MPGFLSKIFPTRNERELKRISPLVEQINSLEPSVKNLNNDQLKAKTAEFRERLGRGETLDQLLPEVFAVVREASIRVLGMRHFDVQLVGGIVLHEGKISEMKTGEGKTLVATLPVYLNALDGKGVHVITVNDYLARRDSEWMGQLYKFLGLKVGVIVHGLTDTERRSAYQADVTYGTNNEFGFDYLRDNMKYSLESYVQREMNYAIVDEVDSILIDEARTPLIISGPSEESTDKYAQINRIIPRLAKGEVLEDKKTGKKSSTGDYTVDEKSKAAVLTEAGVAQVEKNLGIPNLYDPENIEILHHVNQALRAHALYRRDVDYVVKDGKVIIVDEFTGRLMPGRRWSDGLHQAVEAKEGVAIENENQTLATVTFQNFFRMYRKLAGMTGTADTEAPEFAKIYNLEVMVIPPNLPMIRQDLADVIYKTEKEKFNMVLEDIKKRHQAGQPVLVGTISIEKSELLSQLLKRHGIPHHVLNAKNHEREAEIVAQAGRLGQVTISTNMAGRGTDIILGGNPEFLARSRVDHEKDPGGFEKLLKELRALQAEEKKKVLETGGLHILGTERHESRRIDNQLRGRSGRQGDPGSSQFYLSLEDDLLRIFGSERISSIMDRLGMEENEEITHPWITKAIANAQKRVEGHNFEIRKHLLEYDDVMNQQRRTVYGMRRDFLKGEGTREKILDMIDLEVTNLVVSLPEKPVRFEALDLAVMEEPFYKFFDLRIDWKSFALSDWSQETVGRALFDLVEKSYQDRETRFTPALMREAEKMLLLSTLDNLWKDHLLSMDHLREGIGLRGYGQKDPLLEYKREGFILFQGIIDQFRQSVLEKLFRVQVKEEKQVVRALERSSVRPMTMGRGAAPAVSPQQHGALPAPSVAHAMAATPPPAAGPVHVEKVGRNEPCPCGSGKKYKKCCGV
ncbi:MAG: preprotein translocase subunit SecA [Deltaproteobacteria bacterium]|nr:preprotein translocase subunit SecA [Deltaproteobacteria bacterium]